MANAERVNAMVPGMRAPARSTQRPIKSAVKLGRDKARKMSPAPEEDQWNV